MSIFVDKKEIIEINKKYWNQHADLWFGATALPIYGVKFTSENELNLFGDVSGKKMLDICCGIATIRKKAMQVKH